jgi:hypothetical protein
MREVLIHLRHGRSNLHAARFQPGDQFGSVADSMLLLDFKLHR